MDASLFHFINQSLANPVFDTFFPWWTNIQRTNTFFFFLLPLILIGTYRGAKLSGIGVLAVGALLTWGADVLTSIAIKPLFNRERPFETIDAIVRIDRPGSTSFPSGHALDAFFLATFLTLIYPKLRSLYFTLAFLIAFSRVYVGVHYPGDVLAGSLMGCALAYIVVTLFKLARPEKTA